MNERYLIWQEKTGKDFSGWEYINWINAKANDFRKINKLDRFALIGHLPEFTDFLRKEG